MSSNGNSVNGLAADVRTLDGLRYNGRADDRSQLREVARQFESLIMRELVRSMREAVPKADPDSMGGSGALATDMLDQQLAVQMAGLPRGLAEAIERQLSARMAPEGGTSAGKAGAVVKGAAASGSAPARLARSERTDPEPVGRRAPALPAAAPAAPAGSADAAAPVLGASARGFIGRHREAAQRVAEQSGIPAAYLLGQAGHETGWGRAEIRRPDGSPSFNLFGIKAGADWRGATTDITTTEYVGGQARKVVARFRAYESYEAAFQDYARLVGGSARYAPAREAIASAEGWAQGLQRAGYATDPQYADKLSRSINTALRLQRMTA